MPPSGPTQGATAIVVAAGSGTRFGASDKVLALLLDRPGLSHVLDQIEHSLTVDAIVIVAGDHTFVPIQHLVLTGTWSKPIQVVTGGLRRQDSVERGLAAVGDAPVVAVHDGARPLAPAWLFDATITAATVHGAAIAAVPLTDTIKRVRNGKVIATVPRDELWAAHTPQAVRTPLLRRAFAEVNRRGLDVTDEAAMLETLGVPVAIVEGAPANIKITRPEDIVFAEALLRTSHSQIEP